MHEVRLNDCVLLPTAEDVVGAVIPYILLLNTQMFCKDWNKDATFLLIMDIKTVGVNPRKALLYVGEHNLLVQQHCQIHVLLYEAGSKCSVITSV